MRFSVWPGPGNPWQSTLEVARHAEAAGWDGIWYADHFMPNTPTAEGPTNESWTTLAALAAAVPRLRIGTLVTGNTYRHPAVLAKMAAGVDIISGGRLVLGLGAGWQENEHRAYGIEFSTVGGRLRRLEEACQIIRSLFENRRTTFNGRYYQLKDAPLDPKPVQQHVPLLIGGGGEKVTLRIAAKYADEWNIWGTPQMLRDKMVVLDQHCEAVGRDPASITRTAVALLMLTDDQEAVQRARASGRPVVAGTVDQVRETIAEYQEAGVGEFIVPDFTLGTGEQRRAVLDTFINEVAPHFR